MQGPAAVAGRSAARTAGPPAHRQAGHRRLARGRRALRGTRRADAGAVPRRPRAEPQARLREQASAATADAGSTLEGGCVADADAVTFGIHPGREPGARLTWHRLFFEAEVRCIEHDRSG